MSVILIMMIVISVMKFVKIIVNTEVGKNE